MTTQPQTSEPAPVELVEEDIRLKHLLVLPHTQSRTKLDDEVVQEYSADMQAGAKFPPITVCKIVKGDQQGKYVLVDGFHRVAAAQLLKAKTVKAWVFEGAMTDAIHFATGANIDHGLRRTNLDKRRAVIMALQLDKNLQRNRTDRAIADHVGVHHDTVNAVRHELEGTEPKPKKKKDKTPAAPASDDGGPEENVNNPITEPEKLEIGDLDEEGLLIEKPEVLAALKRRGDFDRILDDISSAMREVGTLAADPVGAELNAQQINFDLKGAHNSVKFSRPYTTCPYGPECKSSCKACKGRHWITRAIWDRLDDAIKRDAHKRSGEAHAALNSEATPPPPAEEPALA